MNHPGFHFVNSLPDPQMPVQGRNDWRIIRGALTTTELDDQPVFRPGGSLPYLALPGPAIWIWLDEYKRIFEGETPGMNGRIPSEDVRCWQISCRSPGRKGKVSSYMSLSEAKRWLTNGILPDRLTK